MVKVLVVEDEASIREMIALNLRRSGMEVLEAGSAEEGLTLLEQTPGCSAAILDVMLPGMNGFSLCETIRRTNQKIGIIILSAKGQEQDKIRGLSIGADDYMTKPFSVSELLARVEALCRRVARSSGKEEGGAPPPWSAGNLSWMKPPASAEGGQAHRADPGGVPDHGAVFPQPRHCPQPGKDPERGLGRKLFRGRQDRGCEHPPAADEDRGRAFQPHPYHDSLGLRLPLGGVRALHDQAPET